MTLAGRASKLLGFDNTALAASTVRLALFGVGLAILTLLVVLPLASIFQHAYGSGIATFWDAITSPEALFSLRFTLFIAMTTTLINAVVGTVVATMMVRHEFPLKGVVDTLLDLPIAIPAVVTGFTLVLLYGPLGWLGGFADRAGVDIMRAVPGILIAHIVLTLPLTVRAVVPALRQVDSSQQEAAKTLGASEFKVFVSLIVPSIKGGLLAGSILTFARSLGEFGATIVVSGSLALQTQTAPLFIFSEFSRGAIEAATSMSLMLVVASVGLYVASRLIVPMRGQGGMASVSRGIS